MIPLYKHQKRKIQNMRQQFRKVFAI